MLALAALAACSGPNALARARGGAATSATPATAAPTVVSLTFDDAYENQFRYARPLLLAHDMTATIYVITSDSERPYRCCMSYAQLRMMQADGDDIGSHTVTHVDLTRAGPARSTQEVCQSRRNLIAHGITDPQSFAYPFGAFDAATERIVRACGFRNAREGGGISPSNLKPGAPYRESLPPKDPFDVRTIAVNAAGPIDLRPLEAFVTAAAAHGGGWLPITFHDVCRAGAADFAHCMASYGPIQDTVLDQFLSWLQAAGAPGGAPPGTIVRNMREAMSTRP